MSAQYTKGPWSTDPDDTGYFPGSHYCTVNGDDGGPIAYVMSRDRAGLIRQLPMEENAHLIAAAPCLLEALKDWVAPYNGWSFEQLIRRADPSTVTKILCARAAIAKAEGRS